MRIIHANYTILSPDLDDPNAANKIYRQIEDAGRTCYKSERADYTIVETDMVDELGLKCCGQKEYKLLKNGEEIGKYKTEKEALKVIHDLDAQGTEKFIRRLVKSGHEAMLEHASLTVRFVVDRGVSHELVRHRLASFAQESTRYCNYASEKFNDEITVIMPCFFLDTVSEEDRMLMEKAMDKVFHDDMNVEISMSEISKEYSDRAWAYGRWYDACRCAEEAYFGMIRAGCTPQEARDVLPNSVKTEVVMTANIREWRHFCKLRAAGTTGKPHPQMLEVAVPLLNELRLKLPALFDDIEPMKS